MVWKRIRCVHCRAIATHNITFHCKTLEQTEQTEERKTEIDAKELYSNTTKLSSYCNMLLSIEIMESEGKQDNRLGRQTTINNSRDTTVARQHQMTGEQTTKKLRKETSENYLDSVRIKVI